MSDGTTDQVVTPVPGRVIALTEVPDPVFSAALVGPGTAVDPPRNGPVQAVAPVSGEVVKLHPHAFVVKTPGGAGVLTHLGIDTVQLAGEGFELHVAEGDEVAAGDPVVTWNPAEVEAGGRSPVVPVVALDATPEALSGVRAPGPIAVGDVLFAWVH
ncbi:MAG TPA: PTS glucose transporter subunit IIA [Jiangellaceae bacterium]